MPVSGIQPALNDLVTESRDTALLFQSPMPRVQCRATGCGT